MYISGVRQLQISHGFPDPKVQAMPHLQQILKGVWVELGKAGRPRLPIMPLILKKLKLVSLWQEEGVSWRIAMLWVTSTLLFFAFCRLGKVTVPAEGEFDATSHLTLEDLSVDKADAPTMMFLRLKKSKADPYSAGVTITVGVMGDGLCLCSAYTLWLKTGTPIPVARWLSPFKVPLSWEQAWSRPASWPRIMPDTVFVLVQLPLPASKTLSCSFISEQTCSS